MREFKNSALFAKKISRLKGKERNTVYLKIKEILLCKDINHYKNLKYELKKFKRVHVNKSFIILFRDKSNVIHFIDYEHHDKVYEKNHFYKQYFL
ncbi:MAG: mRNA-degrading endonuclease RelE of RelBE toxin-antitoxin system [Candidatus Woesearchaeota archaeon]|jgi:mRNA-degrading endonuclease RelE of RelBE toxin-antitoxin system